MRRFAFLICLLFVVTAFSTAEEKSQSGSATRNEDDRSLKASHARLAFGTRIRIINQDNQKAVIVTINGRIPEDPDRIVWVGTLAADNIGIDGDRPAPVVIEVLGRKKWPENADPALNPVQIPDLTLPHPQAL
jgi:rare lipoprotein A